MRVCVRAILLFGVVPMMGLAGCSDQVNERVATRLNLDASLAGELPSHPFQGRVITSWIDKRDSTMSTMLGNDVAVQYARTNAGPAYPAGAVLSVVTWAQQEDARWFGGNIPEKPKAVEFVRVSSPGSYSYERFEGSPLRKVASMGGNDSKDNDSKDRAVYLMAQRAAVMP
jgi:hypothetical protein